MYDRNGREHDRAGSGIGPIGVHFDSCMANGETTAFANHLGGRDELVSLRWRKQIDLELGGEDIGVRRSERIRSLAARAIGDGRNNTRVKEAVLLTQALTVYRTNRAPPRRQVDQVRVEGRHETLPGK